MKKRRIPRIKKKINHIGSDFDDWLKREGIEFEKSSGNVFADLGFPNADEMLTKAEEFRQLQKQTTTDLGSFAKYLKDNK